MSTLFDREHPPRRDAGDPDDDTAEIPVAVADHRHDPASGNQPPARLRPGRLQSTIRARRLQAIGLLAAYTPASLGSFWLLFLAFLRLNLTVMAVLAGLLAWFGPPTVRLARWLRHLKRGAQRPRLSRLQGLAASVLAGTYAWLFVDWLLHQ